ncbi:SRPBCC family protein [Nocardioidaceae bacterium SCSIO 66511]|nr:SRPBCC family protein [Nocardioidaceae bacterium SCSIO 66511]
MNLFALGADVAAPADQVWELLVDTDAWPQWGPSVREVHLASGARQLTPDVTGRVRVGVGPALPFAVRDWREGPEEYGWSWRVVGVVATDHRVRPAGPRTCRVEFTWPWWAPAYGVVVLLALRRLRRMAERGERGGDHPG